MRLRIATCRPLPEPDPDEDALLAALRAHGVRARMAAWNDPRERWDEPEPTLIRSTWDYVRDPEAFLAWTQRAGRAAPLWNPPEVVRGNVHKRYLLELARRGVAVIDTELVARGAAAHLGDVLRARGWSDVVVKPAIGAASFATLRFRAGEHESGQAHLARLLARGDALVQRYEPSVETSGERALVWIDGAFTHAVRKAPRFGDDAESVSAALAIAPDERELAERALEPYARDVLYARVDVARGADGRPRVMELELIEPSLFLIQHPPALARLADAVALRLR